MNANNTSVTSENLGHLKDKSNLHPGASMFGWSSVVFIDLAIQAAQGRAQ